MAPAREAGGRASGAGRRGGKGGRRPTAGGGGLTGALLWLLVVLVPLVFVPGARDAFALPKLMLAGWLGLATVLALALAAALGKGGGEGEPGMWSHPARRPALMVVLPLLAAAALSWAFTGHRAHAAGAMADLAIAGVVLLAWTAGLSSRRLGRPLAGLLVPAALLALVAVLQFHGFHVFGFAGGEEGTRMGVTSLAGNPGHLGGFLALALVVAQAVLPRLAGWRRAAAVAALVLGAYGVAASLTLTSVLALVVGSAVVWWTLLPPGRAGLALAGVAVAGLVLVLAVTPLRERVQTVVTAGGDGQLNALLSGRLDGWRGALWMFETDPLTGVGPGAYVSEFNEAKLALLDQGVPFYRQHVSPTFSNAHQELLEVAAEWGVPGLAAALWAFWVLLAAVRRLGREAREARNGPPERTVAARSDAALGRGGLVVLLILAFVHFPFRIAITAYPALLWAAWLLRRATEVGIGSAATGSRGPTSREKAAGEEAPGQGRPGGLGRALAWGVVLLLVAALGLQTLRARNLLRASRILNTAEQVTLQLAARGQVPPTILWRNLEMLRQAEELAPASVGVLVAQGGQHLLLQRPDEAARQYRRALELEPRPETWFNLGRAQWALEEREAAVESWVTASRLDSKLLRQVPAEARGPVRQGTMVDGISAP